MLIAVPTDAPGGLDARVSDHFGHCDTFTLVQLDQEQLGEVTVIPNGGHEQGGCMAPVMLLKQQGVAALVAGGMGMRPLSGFQQVGITVYHKGQAGTAREAIDGIISGQCRELGEQHVCGGGGGGCGGHHDHHDHGPEPEREVIDGPVTADRYVKLSYRLKDEAGELLDEADCIGYVQGHQQVVPGLEKALEGKLAGDKLEVTVTPQDGYGERDPGRLMEVPLEQLPPGVTPGTAIQAQLPDGSLLPLMVQAIDGDKATLDGNHPLAGKTLVFEVELLSVQVPVPEDLS